MGFLDFLFGKKETETRPSASATSGRPCTNPRPTTPQVNQPAATKKPELVGKPEATAKSQAPSVPSAPFSKSEFERAIKILAKLSYLFRDSPVLASTGGNRCHTMMTRLHSYAGMVGYLYECTYKLGKYSDIVDSQMKTHYALVYVAMSDTVNRKKSLKDLADNWSDVLQSILYTQVDGTSVGNEMKAMQSDIDFVTKMFEKISGSKCRKPINQMTERFSVMVDEATFNPFKITNNPRLQNNPPLPPEFYDVFKRELAEKLGNSLTRQVLGVNEILKVYVFNLVESYYNNVGYVPKTTVDAIIEMCYKAVKATPYGSSFGSVEDVKYDIYYAFLNQ